MIDLAALERLLAAATRGEWGVTRRGGAPTISIVDAEGNPAPRTGMRPCGDAYPTIARLPADYSTDDANAALIAAAVNALPALIAAARERDGWQRAAESQNRQWSQKCGALTEERARREELAAQLLATQQDRYRILSERDALRAEVERLRAVVEAATTLHRRDEWHEDDGNVIWWTLPIEEPPYVGTLLDEDIPDYVTHWTRLVVPALAALDAAKECE